MATGKKMKRWVVTYQTDTRKLPSQGQVLAPTKKAAKKLYQRFEVVDVVEYIKEEK
jgi:hypothetical protein